MKSIVKSWNLYYNIINSTAMKTDAAEQAKEQQSPSKSCMIWRAVAFLVNC